MQPLKTTYHPDVSPDDVNSHNKHKIMVRHAARGIIIKNKDILLLYTKRYDDYSLPGGGVDEGEDIISGLVRELREETGAHGIRNITEFARYDEYRPWYQPDADIIHMISHCYVCEINEALGETAYEPYEISNGMTAMWINIHKAIAHNKATIANSDKKGLSIERDTFLLNVIVEKLITPK